jgi:multicomponent Na+:H+ antiporter subunit D
MNLEVHPVLPLLMAALLTPLLGIAGRRAVSLLAPVWTLWLLVPGNAPEVISYQFLDHQWVLLQIDALSRVFALAFALYTLIAGIYAWTDAGRAPKAASLLLAAGGMGVTLAGDLLTLFFFWELLAVSAMFLIWFGGDRQSTAAGLRYILIHLLGGICLLSGILLLLPQNGAALTPFAVGSLPGGLILAALLINAAMPPLHAWLPDAYPRASIYGTVFLSAFTTKSAVYLLIRLFPGAEALAWAGAFMALYGVLFALLENDIRRLLAYHIVSQVGYMVCGVGLGSQMALNGSSAHAFSHIFYKGLLMMSAGAVIYATGRGKLTQLGGLGRSLNLVFLFCVIGALSISGVPLLNGFISKSMVISAAARSHQGPIELILLITSMGTFLCVALKLPWFIFLGTSNGPGIKRAVPRSMNLAMTLAAAVCVLTGLVPALLYGLLPYPVDYAPYTLDHVLYSLQLFTGTALGFWMLRKSLGGQPTITLDTDRFYRQPLYTLVRGASLALVKAGAAVSDGTLDSLFGSWRILQNWRSRMSLETVNQQTAMIWIAVAAAALLLFFAN